MGLAEAQARMDARAEERKSMVRRARMLVVSVLVYGA